MQATPASPGSKKILIVPAGHQIAGFQYLVIGDKHLTAFNLSAQPLQFLRQGQLYISVVRALAGDEGFQKAEQGGGIEAIGRDKQHTVFGGYQGQARFYCKNPPLYPYRLSGIMARRQYRTFAMNHYLALTVIADDRPGIVEKVAEAVSNNDGSWLESAMSRLGGKFAGILLVRVPAEREAALKAELERLAELDIRVTLEPANREPVAAGEQATLTVLGNDRKGIVREISTILAGKGVNVEALKTSVENAPMSGEMLFRTEATVELPQGLERDDLVAMLEQLSDDLVVEFRDPE